MHIKMITYRNYILNEFKKVRQVDEQLEKELRQIKKEIQSGVYKSNHADVVRRGSKYYTKAHLSQMPYEMW